MRISLFHNLWTIGMLTTDALSDSTQSTVLCKTLLGKFSKNPVPSLTVGVTVTSKATLKVTSTPSSVITLPAATTTTTSFVTITSTTSIPADLVVATSFSTVNTFVQSTTTITSTVTSTGLTTTTRTTTVSTSSGFIPAASQTTLSPRKMMMPRGIEARAATTTATRITIGSNGRPTYTPSVYPTSVVCGAVYKITQTSTQTITAATTTTVTTNPPPASTVVVTATTSTTSTIYGNDLTTSTLTATTTIPSTILIYSGTTTTTTTTQTVDAPEATYYAACGPDNYLNVVDGNRKINVIAVLTGGTQFTVNSRYDCCASCLSDPKCAGAIPYTETDCRTFVNPNGQCSNAQTPAVEYESQLSSGGGITLIAGQCGRFRRTI